MNVFFFFVLRLFFRFARQVGGEGDEKAWCTLTAEANNKVLGKRLGKQLAGVKKALAKLDADALWPVLEVGGCTAVWNGNDERTTNLRICYASFSVNSTYFQRYSVKRDMYDVET